MQIASIVSLVIGGYVASLILYHFIVVERAFNWKAIVLALVILGVSASPFSYRYIQQQQDNNKAELALSNFKQAYPQAQLSKVQRFKDSWLYQYTNEGTPHIVLYIGGAWLQLSIPPVGVPIAP